MNEKQSKIISSLKKRHDNLITYLTDNEVVSYFKGKASGSPENLKYDDSLWEKINLPYEFDMNKDVWFRKKIIVPKEIEGILLKGSKLEICSQGGFGDAVVFGHGELYIDDKKIFEEQNWIDFRYRYLVSTSVTPGDIHNIIIHFYKREDYVDLYPRSLVDLETHYSIIDNIAFELESFIQEISFAESLPEGINILNKIFYEIDIGNIEKINNYTLVELLNSLRNKFTPLKSLAKKRTVHLIGHAHIDMNWLWPMDETEDICKNTFTTVLKLMKLFPNFCFSQSQAYIYKIIEEKYPALFKEIKKRVAEGRWDITASTWVELDLNMANGEAIIRQILYAKKYIKEKFNFEPKIFWSPDTYGHPWTIPQILKKSGIDYYYFMRSSQKDYDLFWWKGPDGSKVLAFNSNYSSRIEPYYLCELAKYTYKIQNTNTSMFVYGIGDHGGGPTVEDIETVMKLENRLLFPQLIFSTTHNYFETVINQTNIDIPVFEDEINCTQDGTYTTHCDIKVHNRNCERLMLKAETLGALSKITGFKYPDLEEVWKITLFNQFHDILPGGGIKPTFDYSNALAEKAENTAGNVILKAITEISQKININKNGIPIIIFNNLSWERTDVARIQISDINAVIPKNPVVKDTKGNIVPSQILNGELIFIAQDLPSLGYKVFYIFEGFIDNTLILTSPLRLENEFYVLEVDEDSGTISYLYDKKNDKLIMKKRRDEGLNAENAFPMKIKDAPPSAPLTAVTFNNMLQILYEEPHPFSAEVIGPISKIVNLIKDSNIEILSTGPVVGIIRVKNKLNNSTIIQDITMYREIDRIDFNTFIDWQEKSTPDIAGPMLKASLTPILDKTKATFEIPFGYIERVGDGREFPALNWADISDTDYGLSLLSDTKYGFDVTGNTIRITLVRTGCEYDPEPDIGKHFFTYSIYPHKGALKKSDTVRKGYEINHKLLAYPVNKNEGAIFPDEKSFIEIDSPDVIMTCFKKAEGSEDLILRVYESRGKKVKTTISFGFDIKNIEEVDLIENHLSNLNVTLDNKLDFTIDQFEIKTFRIKV